MAAELSLPAEELLTWLAVERGRSKNTLAAYRRDLAAYEEFLRARAVDLDDVDDRLLNDYVAFLRASGLAPASVARSMVSVRSLHRFLALEGKTDSDPGAIVSAPRVPMGLPKALTEEEVLRLLDAAVGIDAPGLRDRAILEVLYGTGMRISELCGLSLGDIDFEQGMARVLGKGAKERLVPLGRVAREALQEWLGGRGRGALEPRRWARRGDAEAVFLNVRGGRLSRQGAWGVVRVYAARVGLEDRLTPHVLRHSCATHMLERGADIRSVQELLGHASLTTTQIYTKVTPERLRVVYDRAHPRARLSPTNP